jgi:hypothetical protein
MSEENKRLMHRWFEEVWNKATQTPSLRWPVKIWLFTA